MKRRRNSKPKFQNPNHHQQSTPEDFSFTLTKIAVSQICQSIGYKSTDSSITLNTLTLITTKFLQSLAKLTVSFTNTANRTEVNLFDIINALQNISCDYFPGGSMVHNDTTCLIKSTVLRNVFDFVNNSPEIPFAKPLPKLEFGDGDLSLKKNRSLEMMLSYVPSWLPPFPDTSVCVGNCTKERSDDYLWENSVSVIGSENENLQSCNRGKSGGILPVRRAIVRFKVNLRLRRRLVKN